MARPRTKELDDSLLADAFNVLSTLFGEENVRQGSSDEIDILNVTRGDTSFGSFKFNAASGKWADFATGMAGKGIVALVAKIEGVGMVEAMRRLTDEYLAGWSPEDTAPKKKPNPAKALAVLKIEPVHDESIIDGRPEFHPELGAPTAIYDYRTLSGDLAFSVYRFDLGDGKKETRPVSYSTEKAQWVWKYPPPPWPLYRMGKTVKKKSLLSGGSSDEPIPVIINEGEKSTNASATAFPDHLSLTSASGSGNAFKSDWSLLRDAPSVLVIPDNDQPGAEYGLTVAALAFCNGVEDVLIVNPADLGWAEGDDIADHPDATLEQLTGAAIRFGIVAGEPNSLSTQDIEDALVKAAASLSIADYDRAKDRLCKRLGIGKRSLDALVKEAREELRSSCPDDEEGEEEDENSPRSTPPFDGPVDAAQVFAEVKSTVTRFSYLPEEAADAVALWLMLSWKSRDRAVNTMPLLMLTSPMKRCGKSTLIEVLMCLCNKPLVASNVSSATIFRAIGAWEPVVLLDEADTYLNNNEELGGVLNSGHRRSTAKVWRVEERDGIHVPVPYSTWAPKVVAGIGRHASDTLVDRSIVIRLARKPADIKVQRLNPDRLEKELEVLRSKLARWALDATLPEEMEDQLHHLNDRAAMNWSQLLRVATTCSSEVASKCMDATRAMGSAEDMLQDRGADLLADIRQVLPALRKEADSKGAYATEKSADGSTTKAYLYPSGIIIKALNALEDRPWADYSKGKGLSAWNLASMLRPFKLETTVAWGGGASGKQSVRGYAEVALKKVFSQYLDGPDPGQEGK